MFNISVFRQQNLLLSGLGAADWALLQGHMRIVELTKGAVLHEAGVELSHVHFPTAGVVSLLTHMSDGASCELATVGNDGVVGICAFMGGGCAHSTAVVQSAGYGVQMPATLAADLTRRSHAVLGPVMRYAQSLFVHMGQTVACNRHHGLNQQLCRWLLLNLDRMKENQLLATQQQIAAMLGVRREGITSEALKLQKAGLISYGRGRISILNRKGLEQLSCECYSVVTRAYDRLLG